jgi:hypothetical protein
MTTGADEVRSRLPAGSARTAARASFAAGAAGALANMLVLAFVLLGILRPSAVQAALWPLACAAAGVSAASLIPVALVLGGASVVVLGVASMALSAVLWLLLATGLLAWSTGASLLAGCGLGLAAWLILVCRGGTVPPRAARVGRRAGIAALVGTALVAVGQVTLPMGSPAWWAVLLIGGVPAAIGWLAVPAWSLRLAKWFHFAHGAR